MLSGPSNKCILLRRSFPFHGPIGPLLLPIVCRNKTAKQHHSILLVMYKELNGVIRRSARECIERCIEQLEKHLWERRAAGSEAVRSRICSSISCHQRGCAAEKCRDPWFRVNIIANVVNMVARTMISVHSFFIFIFGYVTFALLPAVLFAKLPSTCRFYAVSHICFCVEKSAND